MFNQLLAPDQRLGSAIDPSNIILYLPMTSNFTDQGYYGMSYTPMSTRGAGYTPVISGGWGLFASANNTQNYLTNGGAAAIFRHSIFNTITNGVGLNDFTIEFNIKIIGDGNSQSNAANLKTFPFSFVGSSTVDVFTTVQSPGTQILWSNGNSSDDNAVEMGMTIGSHTAPGGFGFGVGMRDGTNIGYAAACTNNDSASNSFTNRGIAAVPTGNSATWGPYYIAIVRRSGVISIFVNGKKVNTHNGADENGDGVVDSGSTWGWGTFKFDTTAPITM